MPIELTRISEKVAAEVRAEMARQGKSINDLADAIGIPLSTARRSVKGHRPMNLDELADTAEFLGISMIGLLQEAKARKVSVA